MGTNARNINLQLGHLIRARQNVLNNPDSEGEAVERVLNEMKHLLPVSVSQSWSSSSEAPLPVEILPQARKEFLDHHYRKWLELLIKVLSVELISKFPKGQIAQLFDVFFLEGAPADSFSTLIISISTESQMYKVHICTRLLEAFLHKQKLSRLMWDQCEIGKKRMMASGKVDQYTQTTWHELITYIATVPERVTNKLHQESGETFYPEHYIPLLVRDIEQTLLRVHDEISNNREASVQFVSQLVGKVCITGYGARFWESFMPVLVAKMENDYIWSRVMENVLRHVPDMTLEATITPMIQASPWYGTLVRLLGNTVTSKPKLEYLLTNKLFLLRHYEKDILPQNIIGYLATSPSRKHLFMKVLECLLEVWGDASSVKHTSYAQHQYISRCILICIAFLSDKDGQEHRSKITDLLLSGMHPHLDSPLPQIRRLGMIVSENLTKKVDQSMQHKLTFEYDKDDEVNHLLSLLEVPEDPGLSTVSEVGSMQGSCEMGPEKATEKPSNQPSHSSTTTDLDSDDDLEPYDLTNDTKVSKVKVPLYVRDCMEGLLNTDDPDKVEVSLMAAEKLIIKNPSTIKEVAVEFTKILVHLEDRFSLPAFVLLRQAALVRLATTAPTQVADYLTSQVYDRNYNIRQRLDMLEVLAAAARDLSRPEEAAAPGKPCILVDDETDTDWRKVVQRRIDAKTRRIAHSSKQPQAPQTPNRFASVAGHFFFPLLKGFDRAEVTLDLLGRDHLVLSRLLYTLGVVLHAAINTLIVRQMGSSMLEFIWIVRFHQQPAVRRGALFAVSMVILSVPSFILVSEMQKEITEAKSWLEDVVKDDPDKECQRMALQAMMLMENVIKEGIL